MCLNGTCVSLCAPLMQLLLNTQRLNAAAAEYVLVKTGIKYLPILTLICGINN